MWTVSMHMVSQAKCLVQLETPVVVSVGCGVSSSRSGGTVNLKHFADGLSANL